LGAVGWTTINNHFHPNLLLSLSAVVNSSLFFIKKRSNSTFKWGFNGIFMGFWDVITLSHRFITIPPRWPKQFSQVSRWSPAGAATPKAPAMARWLEFHRLNWWCHGLIYPSLDVMM
jgi:hypothetical protein